MPPERGIPGHHAAQFDLGGAGYRQRSDEGLHASRASSRSACALSAAARSPPSLPLQLSTPWSWYGTCVLVKLNWRDIRELLSDCYHLPPTVHATFLSNTIVCGLRRARQRERPGALKVPFFHNNDEFDESISPPGQLLRATTSSPACSRCTPGFHHGPCTPGLGTRRPTTRASTSTPDEVAVMIDLRYPLELDNVDAVKVPVTWTLEGVGRRAQRPLSGLPASPCRCPAPGWPAPPAGRVVVQAGT